MKGDDDNDAGPRLNEFVDVAEVNEVEFDSHTSTRRVGLVDCKLSHPLLAKDLCQNLISLCHSLFLTIPPPAHAL